MLLGHLACGTQFIQRHFLRVFPCEYASLLPGFRGHLFAKFMEVFCHVSCHLVSFPPCFEFIGVFDLPCHLIYITFMEYNFNGITWAPSEYTLQYKELLHAGRFCANIALPCRNIAPAVCIACVPAIRGRCPPERWTIFALFAKPWSVLRPLRQFRGGGLWPWAVLPWARRL